MDREGGERGRKRVTERGRHGQGGGREGQKKGDRKRETGRGERGGKRVTERGRHRQGGGREGQKKGDRKRETWTGRGERGAEKG